VHRREATDRTRPVVGIRWCRKRTLKAIEAAVDATAPSTATPTLVEAELRRSRHDDHNNVAVVRPNARDERPRRSGRKPALKRSARSWGSASSSRKRVIEL